MSATAIEIPNGCRVTSGGQTVDVIGQPGHVLNIAVQLSKPAQWTHVQEIWTKEGLKKAPSSETLHKYAQRARKKLGKLKGLFACSTYGCEWRPTANIKEK